VISSAQRGPATPCVLRRAVWLLLVAWLSLESLSGSAGVDARLEPARELDADAALANARGLPILLAVTRELCSYCEQLKSRILLPMLRSGNYNERVIIRELRLDSRRAIRGFDGKPTTSGGLADVYEATFVPTVLLLDPSGRELVPRIVGVNTLEMYGYYLDQAIDQAQTALRSRGQ
jgi:thioredoxin-related protein